MQIEIEPNKNCEGSEQFFFSELGPSCPIRGIRVMDRAQEAECDVVGVEKEGVFVEAFATKVADSGAGFAFLITGGAWGIRLRPATHGHEVWDLSNWHQWGEPFKLYGEEDIFYVSS